MVKKIYYFDIDGTICRTKNANYRNARPMKKRIDIINQLYEMGHIINFKTARGTTTGIDWREATEEQLKEWGAKYYTLEFGKMFADFFVDDKGINSSPFFEETYKMHLADVYTYR